MYLWRKIAEPRWLGAHENILQACSGGRLAIISKPGRKRRQLEIACTSRDDSRKLVEEFGGRVEKLPRDWLQRFARLHQSKPIKVGKRLVIAGKIDFQTSKAFGLKKPRLLVIPASAAF
ncbi:MAG: hypothetical protein DME50_08455, partial [Verrucomicrobia bacterium]